MKLKWLAHAAFLITADDGTRIITDPYETGKGLQHGAINESADIVTVSHEHGDHNNTAAVKGNPQVVKGTTEVVKGTTEVKGISFKAVPTAHAPMALASMTNISNGIAHNTWIDDIQPNVNVPKVDTSVHQSR